MSVCEQARLYLKRHPAPAVAAYPDFCKEVGHRPDVVRFLMKAEGKPWAKLRDEYLKSEAGRLLKVYKGVKVAQLLGYTNPGSFYSAYERWHGRRIRKNLQ